MVEIDIDKAIEIHQDLFWERPVAATRDEQHTALQMGWAALERIKEGRVRYRTGPKTLSFLPLPNEKMG